jgi:catecholate siderophore receptor
MASPEQKGGSVPMKTKKPKIKKNNSKARRNRKSSSRQWLAVGTVSALVAYSAILGKPHPLLADTAPEKSGPKGTKNTVQALTVRNFQIAPGTLDGVLKQFKEVTGIEAVAQNESILSISSPGAAGMLTTDQALKEIFSGTGVTYSFTNSQTILLQISGPDTTVEVTGPMATVSSPKYQEPLRDVPQTITVIPKTVIEEQGATNLRDVLRNVPGLTMTAGEGGTPAGDNLTLRGFSARNDVFVDGVRDIGPQSRDTFNLEQVEVVKGPDSLYTGRGSTGGSINLVSKNPGSGAAYTGTLSIGNADTKRVTADLNQPIKALGENTAFRLNMMGHDSNVPGRDVVTNQRWGIAPSIGFGLGTPTRFTASYFHLTQDNISDYGIPWVTATNNALAEFRDRPAPVPRDTFYGFLYRDRDNLKSVL